MSSSAQSTLPFVVTTPFGDGKLLIRTIQGEERLSGLFQYTLEMVSTDNSLDFTQIVGKGVTVTMTLVDGSSAYLHGIVGRFVQAGTDVRITTYYADLHPQLWLLTLSSNCKIFQNKTAPDIIKQVLSDGGVTDKVQCPRHGLRQPHPGSRALRLPHPQRFPHGRSLRRGAANFGVLPAYPPTRPSAGFAGGSVLVTRRARG